MDFGSEIVEPIQIGIQSETGICCKNLVVSNRARFPEERAKRLGGTLRQKLKPSRNRIYKTSNSG